MAGEHFHIPKITLVLTNVTGTAPGELCQSDIVSAIRAAVIDRLLSGFRPADGLLGSKPKKGEGLVQIRTYTADMDVSPPIAGSLPTPDSVSAEGDVDPEMWALAQITSLLHQRMPAERERIINYVIQRLGIHVSHE